MKKIFRRCAIIACLVLFFGSIGCITYIKYNQYQEQKTFEELEKKKKEQEEQAKLEEQKRLEEEQNKAQEETATEGSQEEKLVILSEYKNLYAENSDLYGWIKIDDTIIDYPVMQTSEDPNYYNHHNWNRQETISGTPFVDGRTMYGKTENTIIYGHNMKDRTMFGSLREYKEKSFYENHKYIEFNSIYEKEKYEIIAISKAVIYYDITPPKDEYLFYEHVELNTQNEFDKYVQNIKDNAYFDTGVTAQYGDKLITLCTCDYWTENARLLVVAKKIN